MVGVWAGRQANLCCNPDSTPSFPPSPVLHGGLTMCQALCVSWATCEFKGQRYSVTWSLSPIGEAHVEQTATQTLPPR